MRRENIVDKQRSDLPTNGHAQRLDLWTSVFFTLVYPRQPARGHHWGPAEMVILRQGVLEDLATQIWRLMMAVSLRKSGGKDIEAFSSLTMSIYSLAVSDELETAPLHL